MSRASTHRRGLTLLEMLLAMGLMVVVMGVVQMFYVGSLRTADEGEALCRDVVLAQAALRRIAEDIRSCSGFLAAYGPGIAGDAHFMVLHTVRLPDKALFEDRSIRDEPLPAECDITKIQYYVAEDEEEMVELEDGTEQLLVYGLVRWEQNTLHQPVLVERDDGQFEDERFDVELWADEIKYLGFRYFDGVEWVLTWEAGPGNSLPQAVEVTVGFTPVTEEQLKLEEEIIESQRLGEQAELPDYPYGDRYAMVVRVPQADVFLGSRLMRARSVGMANLGEQQR
ncbi:MAG TPA: hypothetical protein VMZ31_01170 [Phycisphaerae bacterium]|nr:hypothetical protein [Phycisphaerae bacterium]